TAWPDERGIGGRMLVDWVAGWRGMRNYLEERGLREGSHGEIVNLRGRTIFEVSFARAIRKVLGE
ncbi:hypothetical protein RYA07_13105, partial [Pseudomonas syringae pv. actinidiae]|nr:hypothetical protein [Pseudomonas syringae pv. actinidiae]